MDASVIMKRRSFTKLLTGACLVSIITPFLKEKKERRVLLIIGELKDEYAYSSINERKIKSNYKEIPFKDLKNGDIFMLEDSFQAPDSHIYFDGPLKALSNPFRMNNTYGIKVTTCDRRV